MNFDRLAQIYRGMEYFLAGSILQRARTCWFPQLSGARRALVVGEGVGRSLEVLLRIAPELHITVVEASARMIAVARKRLERRALPVERVNWINGDVLAWPGSPEPFDVVMTPFVLDCFCAENVARAVALVARQASPSALWLHSDFQIPSRGWRKWRGQCIHRMMYAFFRLAVGLEARAVTSPEPALKAGGFELAARREYCAGLIRADLWTRFAGRADLRG
jgi:ubiquinone/menaquinone biosynthesis C-methylase UbiE